MLKKRGETNTNVCPFANTNVHWHKHWQKTTPLLLELAYNIEVEV